MDINAAPLLEVDGLWVRFGRTRGRFAQGQLEAIRDLSLTVRAGEIVAVVGASGAGKSLLAQAVMGLLPTGATMGGALRYKGQPLTPKRQRQLRGREMALVPQAITWLDPLMRVGPQVRGGDNRPQQAERQRAVFARLGLAPQTERLYPFQLSGGMARRVLLSTAVIGTAQLLIADEPTPGMAPGQAAEALGICGSWPMTAAVYCSSPTIWSWPCALRAASWCSTPAPRWRRLWPPTLPPAPPRCATPTARRCGGPCRKTALRPPPAANPTPAHRCPAACMPPAARL